MREKNDNLAGMKFGKLTAIKRVENIGGHIAYECLCDCGRTVIVKGTYLKNGKRVSCGHEVIASVPNEYDLSGEYGICYMSGKQYSFIFDKDKYSEICKHHWFVNNNGYPCAYSHKKTSFPHRIVTNCPQGMEVDHINHNVFDNRVSNLRICTHSDNMKNRSIYTKNKSGYPGIFETKKYGYWYVSIGVNGKHKYIGQFKNKEDAINARKQAEIKYFGEFANTERS